MDERIWCMLRRPFALPQNIDISHTCQWESLLQELHVWNALSHEKWHTASWSAHTANCDGITESIAPRKSTSTSI